MQKELDALPPPTPIQILAVNEIGYEAGSPSMTAGRDLPWLQDVAEQQAKVRWGAAYADLFVLDGANVVITVYDLELNELSDPDKYEELKAILLAAAEAESH